LYTRPTTGCLGLSLPPPSSIHVLVCVCRARSRKARDPSGSGARRADGVPPLLRTTVAAFRRPRRDPQARMVPARRAPSSLFGVSFCSSVSSARSTCAHARFEHFPRAIFFETHFLLCPALVSLVSGRRDDGKKRPPPPPEGESERGSEELRSEKKERILPIFSPAGSSPSLAALLARVLKSDEMRGVLFPAST